MTQNIFIGEFPKEICEELESKIKSMLIKIYQTGQIFVLRELDKTSGVLVLDTWNGENQVVLLESMREISLWQNEKPNEFKDYFMDETHFFGEHRASIAIRASHLLCEYLFPGKIYTKYNLREEKTQKTLHFLQDLFPEENFIDIILHWRMDDCAVWNAVVKSGLDSSEELYENIALSPAPDILLRGLEKWRHSIEEPMNDRDLLNSVSIYKLDALHPVHINSSTSLTFFLLCLRRELLKQFDFANDPEGETVRAAMLLNNIRNGGGFLCTNSLELPEQVYLRLFIVEWEVLVQLLAFLSKIPANCVRKLTQRSILQRGEAARKHLSQNIKLAELQKIKQMCKTIDYYDILFLSKIKKCPYSAKEVVSAMRHSTNYQVCLEKQYCHMKCTALLRELSEQKIWFPKKICETVCEEQHYALLLAVKAIAYSDNGVWNQELAAQFINQYFKEMGLFPLFPYIKEDDEIIEGNK